MKILGYFPGVDFDSSDQFGRRVHVKELVRNFNEIDECSAWFLIGAPAREFEDLPNVRDAGYSDSTFGRMLYEMYRCVYLFWFIKNHDIDLIYTRDSPYFATTFVNLLTGVALVVEANGIPGDEGGEAIFRKIRKKSFNYLRRLQRNQASEIVAVSEGIRDHLIREDSTYHISIIENGVDVDQFMISSPVKAISPYTICYVGGLQRWQGIETIIQVVGNLEFDAKFIIVGGTQERRSELKRFISENEIGAEIEFIGRVPHEKVPYYINQADLCLGPFVESRKASPLKIYEYVSCGREVVYASNNGLDRIESIPGVHRLNYCPDINVLAADVDQIISNVDTNYSGRKYILDRHSWGAVSNSVYDVCLGVVHEDKFKESRKKQRRSR